MLCYRVSRVIDVNIVIDHTTSNICFYHEECLLKPCEICFVLCSIFMKIYFMKYYKLYCSRFDSEYSTKILILLLFDDSFRRLFENLLEFFSKYKTQFLDE